MQNNISFQQPLAANGVLQNVQRIMLVPVATIPNDKMPRIITNNY